MPRFGTLLSLVLFAGSLAPLATRPAPAAVKEFPYEAVIEADEAYVRCGPGKNFYATMKLTRGQHVTVRRHDPGGWFMIDPPAGSFSLIRIEDVVQQGKIATVKQLDQGQISVRIGSSLDPTADSIFQRKLSSGEQAEILGEALIPRKGQQVAMFRIRPPRGEFRWIEGNDLAPLDPQIKQQQESDPFSTPQQARTARRNATNQPPLTGVTATPASQVGNRPAIQLGVETKNSAATTATKKNGTATRQIVIQPASFDPRGRLEQIDGQFRDMIQRDPPTWNLTQIEQAYLELRRNPAAAGVAGQVDLRFSALAHYKQVKSQYDDYYRLVSGTSQRDAELAAVENSLAPQNARPAIGPTPQGGWQTAAPSQDANYQSPARATTTTPTLSVPSYATQPNPPQNLAQQNPNDPSFGQANSLPPSPGAPNVAVQAPSESPVRTHSQSHSQNGLTLGAPVPLPGDDQSVGSPAPSQPPAAGTAIQSNAMPPGPGTAPNSGAPPQTNAPPLGSVGTDPASDLDIQSFPGEIGPAQNAAPAPHAKTHTSQFAPNSTGQTSPYQAAQSPSAMPPASGNVGLGQPVGPTQPFELSQSPSQAGPNGTMAPPSRQQSQPLPSQSQSGYPPSQSGAAQPFELHQQQIEVHQPQMQLAQPAMQQSPMQQQSIQQPGMPQSGFAQPGPQPNVMQQPVTAQQSTVQPNAFPANGNALPPMAPPRQIRPPGSPPLDGAGVVQRAATSIPNGPRHVLLAPNGRILAYLQADRGVNLDAYVGRQMGVMGYRAFRSDLQTDLIIVRGIVPVRLVQQ